MFFGIAGIAVGALSSTQQPIFFLQLGAAFVICAFVVRRINKRYEAEVLPLAAEELEAESKSASPTPQNHYMGVVDGVCKYVHFSPPPQDAFHGLRLCITAL